MKKNIIICSIFLYLIVACSAKKKYTNYVNSEKEKLKKEVVISNSEKLTEEEVPKELVNTKLPKVSLYDKLPKKVNLKPFLTEAKDQGDRHTCAYFAFCGLLEAAYKKKHKKDINLSEEYLISVSQGKFYGANESCSIITVASSYLRNGIVEEDAFPYQPSWTNYGFPYYKYRNMDSIPSNAYKQYKPKEIYSNTLNSHYNILVVRGLPNTLNVLAKDSLPVIGVFIMTKDRYSHYDSINGPLKKTTYSEIKNFNEKTGEIKFEIPKSYKIIAKDTLFEKNINEENWENHFMLITGYDKDLERLYLKNSWGKSFGEDGFGFITFSEYKENQRYGYYLDSEFDVKVFEDTARKSSEIKIEEEAIKTNFTKDGALEIQFTGKIQTIPYKSLLIEHKIFELNSAQNSMNYDVTKATAFNVNKNISKPLDDHYLRTYWNSLSDKTKDNFIWTTEKPLKSRLNKQKIKTLLNQYNPNNSYFVCTTITTYDDAKNKVELKRVWTSLEFKDLIRN